MQRLSEEHGILDLRDSDWRPAVGEQVRVVPNHVCIAVHLHEVIYGIRGGKLETSWPVKARGRTPSLALRDMIFKRFYDPKLAQASYLRLHLHR